MLLELHIENLVTIEKMDILWGEGLNIITGETGAGKSIILGALGFALGDRVTPEVIRTGCEKASIEAIFSIDREAIRERISQLMGEDESDGEVILRREIMANGRSRAMFNGRTVNAGILIQMRSLLVEIHGQHEFQTLLDAKHHIEFIDEYGDLNSQRDQVNSLFHAYQRSLKALAKLESDKKQRIERKSLIEFQIQELESAQLRSDEMVELEATSKFLSNAEKLTKGLQSIFVALYERDNSAFEVIAHATKELENLSEFDSAIVPLSNALQEIVFQLEDVVHRIRSQAADIRFSEKRLNDVLDRLHFLKNLQRKYQKTIEELISYQSQLHNELIYLGSIDDEFTHVSKEVDDIFGNLQTAARSLSEERKSVAQRLEQIIEQELAELDMPGAKFHVSFGTHNQNEITGTGSDTVEFLLSANAGETPRALARIASGGELSRIMLGLKHAFVMIDQTPTLVFDEIDAGIGGGTAEVVGNKLTSIARTHQVICITHLHHIAVRADHHFVVSKRVINDRTVTEVKKIQNSERVQELTRMLEGRDPGTLVGEYVESLLHKYRGDV